jgi:hypothetical protein
MSTQAVEPRSPPMASKLFQTSVVSPARRLLFF